MIGIHHHAMKELQRVIQKYVQSHPIKVPNQSPGAVGALAEVGAAGLVVFVVFLAGVGETTLVAGLVVFVPLVFVVVVVVVVVTFLLIFIFLINIIIMKRFCPILFYN